MLLYKKLLLMTFGTTFLVTGGVEKNPGSGVEAEKIMQFFVAGETEISNRQLNVTSVEAGSITAVAILKIKWRRAGNGSVISVDV